MLFMFSSTRPLIIIPPVLDACIEDTIIAERLNYPDAILINAQDEASATALGEQYLAGTLELSTFMYPDSSGCQLEGLVQTN